MSERDSEKAEGEHGKEKSPEELTPREVEEIIRQTGKIPKGWYIPGISAPTDILNPQRIGGTNNLPPLKAPQHLVDDAIARARERAEQTSPEPESRRRTFGPLSDMPPGPKTGNWPPTEGTGKGPSEGQGPQQPPKDKGPKGGK